MTEIRVEGLEKRFGRAPALRGVDLVVPSGTRMVLVGPSGCGKSTLLNVIAGLEAADGGRVLFDGRDVSGLEPRARDVAVVFQSYALYPHLTVRGNLAFPLRRARLPRSEIRRRVEETAKRLSISELLGRRPAALSGGQRQRVALARALVRRPRVFLLDEPLSNLDAQLRVSMRAELQRLHGELGVTFVHVTHDQAEALTLARQVAVMDAGRVLQVGPPRAVYDAPADTFVARFLGSPPMNLLAVRVAGQVLVLEGSGEAVAPAAPWRGLLPDGAPCTLGVRPEHVRLGAEGLQARVALREDLGAEVLLHLELGGDSLVAREGPSTLLGPGDRVRIVLDPARLHAFDARSGARLERPSPPPDPPRTPASG